MLKRNRGVWHAFLLRWNLFRNAALQGKAKPALLCLAVAAGLCAVAWGIVWLWTPENILVAKPVILDYDVGQADKRGAVLARRVQLIAFVFPQFHEFEENNRFWGKGFTEWDNLKRVHTNREFMGVQHPTEYGYYDLTQTHIRRRQAELAKQYGIDGFCYHHYWFSNKPVMHRAVDQILIDGQPDVPFFFNWANEHWTKRWDGNNNDMLLEQTYGDERQWRLQFDYLLPFFKHPRYIKVDGRPVFSIYRVGDVESAVEMSDAWRRWAKEAGFQGMHIIQLLNDVKRTDLVEDANMPQPWVDALAEFQPNFLRGYDSDGVLRSKRTHRNYYRGTWAGWDNTPRHVKDGKGFYDHGTHPYWFERRLTAQIRQVQQETASDKAPQFLFINALNEWGEGNVLEPSDVWGRRYLVAVQNAVLATQYESAAALPQTETAALPVAAKTTPTEDTAGGGGGTVCIVVRTYVGHSSTSLFKLSDFIKNLQALEYREWVALVVLADNRTFPELETIVSDVQDPRVRVGQPVNVNMREYNDTETAYAVADAAIPQCSDIPNVRWLLVTEGINQYDPTALNLAATTKADMIALNFDSRMIQWNEALVLPDVMTQTARCQRLKGSFCVKNQLSIGRTQLGGVILNYPKFRSQRRRFSDYNLDCPDCQDGMMMEKLLESGWKYEHVPGCLFTHNPTPRSCVAAGGVFFDSPLWNEFNCWNVIEIVRFAQDNRYRLDMPHFHDDPTCIRYSQSYHEQKWRDGQAEALAKQEKARIMKGQARAKADVEDME